MQLPRQDSAPIDSDRPIVDVAVIVVNYLRDESALAAVEQLVELLRRAGFTAEGIVCDNSRTINRNENSTYEIIPLDNPGYAAAMNVGISLIEASFYLLCSHEVEWFAGDIRSLLEAARQPNVAAVGPILIDSRTGAVLSAGKKLVHGLPVRVTRSIPYKPYPVDALDGACWMIPRRAWRDIGSLDESYFLYWEESDWQARARAAGLDIICVPDVRVRASASADPASTYYLYRNRYSYVATHISLPRALALAMSEMLFRIPGASARRLLMPSGPRPLIRYRLRALRDWLLGRTGPMKLG